MLRADVVPGVHRIEHSYDNWYLIEEEGRLTIVGAGVPTSWATFEDTLSSLGRQRGDVEAVGAHPRPLRPPAPLKGVVRYEGGTLPVPGSPQVVFTPGHTLGHCALHLPDRDVVIAGDAIVTLNPYTGATGPQIVARAATVDSERNRKLPRRAGPDRRGHRARGSRRAVDAGVQSAVARAREQGVS